MYWSLLPFSNQQTEKINTCISAVVTCDAFLLYSAVGNVVVCSSLTICATQKLSEAVSVTDLVRILRGITLKCFAAASFHVFAATKAWYRQCTLSCSFPFQVTWICHVDIVPRPRHSVETR